MRPRTEAFSINCRIKSKIIKEKGVTKGQNKEEAIKEISNYILEDALMMPPSEVNENAVTHNVKVAPPKYSDIKKEYSKGQDKPLKFHEKSRVFHFNPKNYEDIHEKKVEVNFNTLMAMFDSEELIEEIYLENLLNLNLEKFGEFKEKLENLLSFANEMEDDDGDTKNKIIDVLNAKLAAVNKQAENAQNVQANIDKVEKITFGEKTKISFKK